jgi:hypothetical protein
MYSTVKAHNNNSKDSTHAFSLQIVLSHHRVREKMRYTVCDTLYAIHSMPYTVCHTLYAVHYVWHVLWVKWESVSKKKYCIQ